MALRLMYSPNFAARAFALFLTMICFAATLAAQSSAPARERELEDIVRKRWEWFYNQRAYPLKRIPAGARRNALREREAMVEVERQARARREASSPSLPAVESSTSWTLIGPQPVNVPFALVGGGPPVSSGRVTALAVDPVNSNIVYLGGAEGGVWKTTDGGTTWLPLTDAQASLAVGSIALDPSNPSIVYVGTGEENFNGDSYYGEGILKSTDGGQTWTHITGPFGGPISSDTYFGGGARIGSLALDHKNGQIVLAGVLGGGGDGIWRSTDGGETWVNVLPKGPGTAVCFNPNGSTAYAAVHGVGVFVSTDVGATWAPDNGTGSNTLPSVNVGRIELALDPSNPTTLYAGIAQANGHNVNGLFKTTDGGANWSPLPLGVAAGYCNPQCDYDNVVRVDPVNSSVVYVGGSAGTFNNQMLFRSADGGSTWSEVSQGSATTVLHVDQHALAFWSDGSVLYVGNDGGVWITSNPTGSSPIWSDLNQTLAITQFYPGIAIDPNQLSPSPTFGGTQDNGTEIYAGGLAWTESDAGCGDGGYNAIDPTNSNNVYVACVSGEGVLKSTSGGTPGTWQSATNGINSNDRSSFVPPMVIDPSNPQTLYYGTYRVYQTTNGAQTWSAITTDLTGGGSTAHITTLAVAPSDPNTVYAGTSDSQVQVTTNAVAGALSIWTNVSAGLPPRHATQIAVDRTSSTSAYVTFSGFSGFGDSQGHVFKTTNGGQSWADISGNLPNVPVNDIVIDPNLPNALYVATDVGVFSTDNGGATWSTLVTGLPNVAVLSLKMHSPSRTLRAASHGRSAWDLVVPISSGLSISPTILSFGSQSVGSTSPAVAVTLTNLGSAALSIASITATGDYAATITCGSSLAAGMSCTISVTFTPTSAGTRNGGLTFSDGDPSSPQTVILTGFGAPTTTVTSAPSAISFGNQNLGTTSSPQPVTLTNSGGTTLSITSIAISGPDAGDFSQTNNCGSSVQAGASCKINVTFTPACVGARAATLAITDSAQGSPQIVILAGTGMGPVINLVPLSLSFGDQLVTVSSSALALTVQNTGNANLIISGITISGVNSSEFSQTNQQTNGCSTLALNQNCSVSITFTPAAVGTRTATLTITDNAQGSPQMVLLTGFGTDFTAGAAPGSSTSATIAAGQAASYSLSLAGTQGFSGSLSLSCAGAPPASTCTVTPSSLSLNGTSAMAATVSVPTSSRGTSLPNGGPGPISIWPLNWSPSRRVPVSSWQAVWAALAIAVTLLGLALRSRRNPLIMLGRMRFFIVCTTLICIIVISVALSSCGGGGGSSGGGGGSTGTPAGTYTLDVKASVAAGTTTVSRDIKLTLIVN